ncbi:MAG: 4'-phosphopantetheinyl transferase superfamily protein [Deltaproteobacteria bacterium]|nr:4'-phosphopantetheinyl transferase superfamily protein [Deltaproteobacteria bacterium]
MIGFLPTSISALLPGSSGGAGVSGVGLEVLTPFPHGGLILVASMELFPEWPQNPQHCRFFQDPKDFLANYLWREWMARVGGHGSPGDPGLQPGEVVLAADNLGKPFLRGAPHPAPAISFSRGGSRLWAALGGAPSGLGLDAASSREFAGGYPWHRVFHDLELEHSQKYTGGDRPEAAALLWSAKEAAVKSLGCAFHFFGPRHLRVRFAGPWPQGLLWQVILSGVGVVRGASLRREGVWLSLALG